MPELRLDPAEQAVASAEVGAVRAVTTDATAAERLDVLLGAIDAGAVDDDGAASLERIVDLGLHAGRIRALHGPGGEAAALRLHRRLPAGAAAAASARDVSAALSGLAGRSLEGVELAASGPGRYTLTLSAGGRTLSVRLDRNGARLASVEA